MLEIGDTDASCAGDGTCAAPKLLFRQTAGTYLPANEWASQNPTDACNDNFSILGDLSDADKGPDGKFHFKMVWHKQHNWQNFEFQPQEWKQSVNPMSTHFKDGQWSAADLGYEAVSVPYTKAGFEGLACCDVGLHRTQFQPRALLKGSTTPAGSWWYAVGAIEKASDRWYQVKRDRGFPGPAHYDVAKMELYVITSGEDCAASVEPETPAETPAATPEAPAETPAATPSAPETPDAPMPDIVAGTSKYTCGGTEDTRVYTFETNADGAWMCAEGSNGQYKSGNGAVGPPQVMTMGRDEYQNRVAPNSIGACYCNGELVPGKGGCPNCWVTLLSSPSPPPPPPPVETGDQNPGQSNGWVLISGGSSQKCKLLDTIKGPDPTACSQAAAQSGAKYYSTDGISKCKYGNECNLK